MTIQSSLFNKIIQSILAVVFLSFSIVQPIAAQTVMGLPEPGTLVGLSPVFEPALLKGVEIDPEDPMHLKFIVDKGQEDAPAQAEFLRLIKYFLAALTIPEENVWVNLSPYEEDLIISKDLSGTEMGRDLLAQDYLLKQLAASLIYPEDELGKKFWDKVYAETHKRFGTTEIPINTFNKVWIVPDEAVVYEVENTAFVATGKLKVMLEEDYLSLENNKINKQLGTDRLQDDKVAEISSISSRIVKEIIVPAIEKEVNEGANFAKLRQIFHSMVLATWFKRELWESLLGQIYVDQSKVKGVDIADKEMKRKIYNQYVEAFKKGTYSLLKEEQDPVTQKALPRKYFSGGFSLEDEGQWLVHKTPTYRIDATNFDNAVMVTVGQSGNIETEKVAVPPVIRQAMKDLNKKKDNAQLVSVDTKMGEYQLIETQKDTIIRDIYRAFPSHRSALIRGASPGHNEALAKDLAIAMTGGNNVPVQSVTMSLGQIEELETFILTLGLGEGITKNDDLDLSRFSNMLSVIVENNTADELPIVPIILDNVVSAMGADVFFSRLKTLTDNNRGVRFAIFVDNEKDFKAFTDVSPTYLPSSSQMDFSKVLPMFFKDWAMMAFMDNNFRKEGADYVDNLGNKVASSDVQPPKDLITRNDNNFKQQFDEYLKMFFYEKGMADDQFSNLARLFEEESEEMILLKEYLLNNPHWRPVFLQTLPQNENEPIEPLKDINELNKFGGEAILEKYKAFSIGTQMTNLETANKKAEQYLISQDVLSEDDAVRKGLKIVVGITDRGHRYKDAQDVVTHGRRVFFPLSDGTFLSPKGVGQFLYERETPYMFPDIGIVPEEEVLDLNKSLAVVDSELNFPQNIAVQRISQIIDSKGELKPVSLLSENKFDYSYIIYQRVLDPDRLEHLQAALETDEVLEKKSWVLSRTLSNLGLIEEGLTLTPMGVMEIMVHKLGERSAKELNRELFRTTDGIRNIEFLGTNPDVSDLRPFTYFVEEDSITDVDEALEFFRRRNLLDRAGIIEETIALSGASKNKLFVSDWDAFKIFFISYFQNLNEDNFNVWTNEMSDRNSATSQELIGTLKDSFDENIHSRVLALIEAEKTRRDN
ncbi:MAG: hypothetical protein KAR05_02350, partial [Candidatus Omnitrophica bacterium]|nr:hypothetical protein [Candidatus Omnitrophota bacterium]